MNDYQDILSTEDCFDYLEYIHYIDNTHCVVVDGTIVFYGTLTECYNYCKKELE